MIHHLSFGAKDPYRVAKVFAEVMNGFVVPFPVNPGSFLAVSGDRKGTGIEVYPHDSVLKPNGTVGALFERAEHQPMYGAVHFALEVQISAANIAEIAEREGWVYAECSRGGRFSVIEIWIENTFLVELLPPEFAAQYLASCDEMPRLAA
jgi:hypothetical protein